VHHVATVYPLEIHLAQMMASGTRILGVTWATVDEMKAAHAVEHAHATKQETMALLAENSAAAADAVRMLSDDDLDSAVPVSLYQTRSSPASSCSRITPSATAITTWYGCVRR
jgi:hypothetical protein